MDQTSATSLPIRQTWPYLLILAGIGSVIAWADTTGLYVVAQAGVIASLVVLALAIWNWYRAKRRPMQMSPEALAYSRAIGRVLACVGIGYFAIIVNAIRYDRWVCGLVARAFGYGTMMAGAAFASGVLLGLLFGFRPTGSLHTSGDQVPPARRHPHTNLEEIADWLTKLILGAGLVELSTLIKHLPHVGEFLVYALEPLPPFRNQPGVCNYGQEALAPLAPIALALLGFFLASGILYGYLWSRWEFALASEVVDCDSTALEAVNSWLTYATQPNEAVLINLTDAIKNTSLSARLKIFLQAEQYRRSSTVEANARTLPIFQALVEADTQELFHRNRAQLAFTFMGRAEALRSGTSDWQRALDLLNKAISIRDRLGEQGWPEYELARAICQIHLDSNFGATPPKKSTAGEKMCILADLEKAKVVPPSLLEVMDRDHQIADWKNLNEP